MTEFHENVAVAANELSKQGQLRLKLAGAVLATTIAVLATVLTLVVIGIQNSRYQDCLAQNARHDRTVAYIERIAEDYEKHTTKAKRAAIALAVKQDKVLIQDLAPHANCAARTQ